MTNLCWGTLNLGKKIDRCNERSIGMGEKF
jgi:hypothetical protein